MFDEKKKATEQSAGFLDWKLIPEQPPRIVDIRYQDLKENFFLLTRSSDIYTINYLKQAQEESHSMGRESLAQKVGLVSRKWVSHHVGDGLE